MGNGKKNGEPNGHKANGDYNLRSKEGCFLAYRDGHSLRWIAKHSQHSRTTIAKWRDECEWDKTIQELNSERLRLHEAKTADFETKYLDDLRGVLDRKLPEIEAKVKTALDLKRIYEIYRDLRLLGTGADTSDTADIIQRVDVSLDPDEEGDE